jgi:hypothetical protein
VRIILRMGWNEKWPKPGWRYGTVERVQHCIIVQDTEWNRRAKAYLGWTDTRVVNL